MRRFLATSMVAVFLLVTACSGNSNNGDGGASDAADGGNGADRPDTPGGDGFCPVVNYAACGGEVVGTWAMRSLCPEDPEAAAALCEHPYDDRQICTGTGNEAICDGSVSGTLTFNADMSIDIDVQVTLVTTWNYTDECLADVYPSGADAEGRCLSMGNDHLTCTYEGHCTCVSDPMVEGDNTTATYTISGNEIAIGEDPPATYCIEGDRLTMDYYVFHPVSWRYWVMERE